MEISTGTALILAFFAGFAYFSRRFMGDLYLERAIVLGPLTGLIMGDLQTGLLIGGTLELIFMGAADIGGSVPPNLPIGSVLGTAFAISGGLTLEEALVIAIPAALLGSFFELLAKTFSTIFVRGAENYAANGNAGGVSLMLHLGNLAHFLAIAIPAYLGLVLGGGAVEAIQAGIPEWLRAGIAQAGNILPALGFGILLSTLASPRLLPWFFLGFVLAAYLSVGVLGTAFVGILAAAIIISQTGGISVITQTETETAAGTARLETLVPQSERTRFFWRSFALQSAFSFDRMQALGFTWIMMPFLQRLYGRTDEFKRALLRHLSFFNTHMWIPGPIIAMVAELEARNAQNPDEVDTADIQAIKGSLMGPLAGIGDSMFHGTLRPLAGGVAASLALQGNPIAPLFFLGVTNVVHVWVRWWSQRQGFRLGAGLFERMDQASLRRIMEGAAIAGLMGVGGLVGTWLNITTGLTYTLQDTTIEIQTMLNNIMPKLLPLLFTLGVYWAIRRGVRVNYILIVLVLIGLIGGALGIIG